MIQRLPRFDHLTPKERLPANGIYVFFEHGESVVWRGKRVPRIVRIGTHNKDGRFPGRIRQHYGRVNSLRGNKNGSVFRKHVGSALLRKADQQDPRLEPWLGQKGGSYLEVEERVSQTLRENFTLKHIRGAPYHPMTQGKIERYHRSMKNVVKLRTFYFPWELDQSIEAFVAYYNNERYHESLDNLTPADVYFGRAEEVKTRREQIKKTTLENRRQQHQQGVHDRLYWKRESSLILTPEMSH